MIMSKRISALFVAAFTAVTVAFAAKPPEGPDPWVNYDEAIFMDMDLDANIETPELQKSEKLPVRKYMRKLADRLARQNYQVELDRDDEVMVVVIPLDRIFQPNDTLLAPSFQTQFTPLLAYMKDPGMFKVVYSIHSDNTGSERYNYDLSQKRVNSVYDWMLDKINEDLIVIPYALGDTDPVASNNTMDGRRTNRRMEIYFIPGPDMIVKARSGKFK